MNQTLLENVEIFTGQTTPTESRVYARLASGLFTGAMGSLPALAGSRTQLGKGGQAAHGTRSGPGLPDGCTLGGWIYGPSCEYARTLPAKISLRDLGDGDGLLAEAVVPDPCCWTPRLPYLYEVTVRLQRGDEVLAEVQRPFGIRTLGARGGDLLLEGKRWVVRGAMCDDGGDLSAWHDRAMAMLVDSPSDQLCRRADRSGVLLIARLAASSAGVAKDLRRLGSFVSVGIVMIDDESARNDDIGRSPAGALLAQRIRGGGSSNVQPWADVIVCDLSGSGAEDIDLAKVDCPVLMCRGDGSSTSPEQSRTACDQLQRDLASVGQFAGYLV